MKNQIRFELFNLSGESSTPFEQVLKCYQEVFGGLPWGELKRCQICNTFWGTQDSNIPKIHCQKSVVDYWPTKAVKEKIGTRTNTFCYLAIEKDRVIGFSIGFPIITIDLEKELELKGSAQAMSEFGAAGQVGYQTDIGVLQEFRQLGIAKSLYEFRRKDFRRLGLKVAVVRTKPGTVTYGWYTRLGYRVIAQYPEPDKRVILAQKIER